MLPLTPFVVLFLAAFLYAPLSSDLETIDNNGASRVLLLTAHPDDEAMFFAPTILALNANANKRNIQARVDASGQTVLSQPDRATSNLFSLCLSTGDAEGLGAIRTEELSQSLDILGIGRDRRWVVDNPHLQDNITADWDPHAISGVIKTYILEHGITTILTFDSAGVSDHSNHKALPEGVKHLLQTLPDGPTKPRLFTLISVPKSGKYVGVMAPVMAKVDLYISKTMLYYDTLITRALERAEIIPAGSKSPSEMNEMKRTLMPVFISGIPAYQTAFKAMLAHKSQLVWFRWLYLLFSRYMWINEWTEVKN